MHGKDTNGLGTGCYFCHFHHSAKNPRDSPDYSQSVCNSFDQMENEKNLKALLIKNIDIPESRNEDLTKVIITLAKHLDATLQAADVESVFRIKNDSNPKPPLIMVKFSKASAR